MNQTTLFDRQVVEILSPDITSAPAHARRNDPDTSKDAAASVKNIRQYQDWVLSYLRCRGPMTDERLVAEMMLESLRYSPSGIRTRRSELVKLGKVEWTGEKVKMSTGRLARVWRAK